MENLYTPNCIRTFTGIYMNVFDPTPEMICIEDIAHALSMQPRFGGHLPEFYSVAQHCYLASLIAEPEKKMESLLHDASEAYMLDIPSPIKKHLTNYKEIEDKLMDLISKKFEFNFPLSQEVKDIDRFMLQFEWDKLMLQLQIPSIPIGVFPTVIECWSPKKAKEMFLHAFDELVYS